MSSILERARGQGTFQWLTNHVNISEYSLEPIDFIVVSSSQDDNRQPLTVPDDPFRTGNKRKRTENEDAEVDALQRIYSNVQIKAEHLTWAKLHLQGMQPLIDAIIGLQMAENKANLDMEVKQEQESLTFQKICPVVVDKIHATKLQLKGLNEWLRQLRERHERSLAMELEGLVKQEGIKREIKQEPK